MSLCNKITNSMCQVLQGYKEATYFEITFNFSKGVQSPRLSPLYFQIGYRTLKGSQSINDLSSFPDSGQGSSGGVGGVGGGSGGSGGTLPRPSRGKEAAPDHGNSLNSGWRARPPRPQSLLVAALENCMTGPGDDKEEADQIIVAEALRSGSEGCWLNLTVLSALKTKNHGYF